jgi:hypothetical protein
MFFSWNGGRFLVRLCVKHGDLSLNTQHKHPVDSTKA